MTTQYPLGEIFRPGPEPCDYVKALPFYGDVPKTLAENLAFREKVLEKAKNDKGFQRDQIEMCRLDRLYWISTYCWLHEPRGDKKIIPFIPWPHQADVLATTQHYLTAPSSEKRDLGFLKSRGEGLSWDILMLFLGEWGFADDLNTFGLISRNELAVDNPKDHGSLMWKLDFQLANKPSWMFPWYVKKRDRRIHGHSLTNAKTGSVIIGYASGGDVASGGRMTAAMFDEVAKFPPGEDRAAINSLQPVTDLMIYVSSPKGVNNEYYKIMHEPSTMLTMVSDWKDNPTRNQGMFRVEKNEIEVIDPENDPLSDTFIKRWPETRDAMTDRGFEIEGRIMSPWYVQRCLRPRATPQSVAQEYDMDFGGSDYQFFKKAIAVSMTTCERPYITGDIVYTDHDCVGRFQPDGGGSLHLWMHLNGESAPVDRYAVTWDLGGGTGGDFTSNSVMTIVSLTRRMEVGKWVSNTTSPEDCARLGVATCRWLQTTLNSWAILSCESNAMAGAQFSQSVFKNTTFRNIWYRRKTEEEGVDKVTTTDKPFHYTRDRAAVLSPLRDAIMRRIFTVKDRSTAEELGQYVFRNGKVVHAAGAESKTESGKAHGDRVMSMAISWDICSAYPPTKPMIEGEKQPVVTPPDSPMGRYLEWVGEQEEMESAWCW